MCKGKPPEHLKLFSFNVEGLKPKLEDPNFLEIIQDYDISILQKHGKIIHLKSTLRGSGIILKSNQNTKMHKGTRGESPYLPDITLDQV